MARTRNDDSHAGKKSQIIVRTRRVIITVGHSLLRSAVAAASTETPLADCWFRIIEERWNQEDKRRHDIIIISL